MQDSDSGEQKNTCFKVSEEKWPLNKKIFKMWEDWNSKIYVSGQNFKLLCFLKKVNG